MKYLLILLLTLCSLATADEKDERRRRREERQEGRKQVRRSNPKWNFQRGLERTPTFNRQTGERLKRQLSPIQERRRERRREDFQEISKKWGDRHEKASRDLRDRVQRRRLDSKHWFRDDFYNKHHRYGYHRRHANWWRPARWNHVALWLPWGWGYPIYYDQTLAPIVLNNYTVVGVDITPDVTPVEEWMPLGIFALGNTEEDTAYSNLFIQLAVSKSGNLSGTLYNAAIDQTYPLSGSVDSETQLASWSVTDDPNSIVMITGLYNLTQDATAVQLYFSEGTNQTWALVRFQETAE